MHTRITLILALLSIFFFGGCDKGTQKPNVPPETKIAIDAINLTGDNRLNSEVHVSWFGTDGDGYVAGFELSFDETNWTYTTLLDSTFQFTIPAGSDTVDVNFYVRAIDDKGATDPTPAFLRIPLKNSLPQATIDADNAPTGNVLSVATYRWYGSDPDGDETIVAAEMRWNNGDWYSIDPRQPLVSFVADTNNLGEALVYYANNTNPEATRINGITPNGTNQLYIRVKDLADAYSPADTAASFVWQLPTQPFLVIGGQPTSVTQVYQPILANLGLSYDFQDFGINGGENQPKFWSPTFRLLLMQYQTAFIYADATTYNNAATGQNAMLLTFMAQGVQTFTDAGRKLFITTQFASTSDMASVRGIYPVEDIVISSGQVRISNDSTIYATTGAQYPDLQPQNILIGIYPIEKTADAEDFYRAQLTKIGGWTGDNLVGVRRRYQGNINHVFFGVNLHQFTKNPGNLQNLFQEILLNDFNW